MQVAAITMKPHIDISKWWKKNELGQEATVHSVYRELLGTDQELGRLTLKRAKDGELEKAEIEKLQKLAEICSIWAEEEISVSDLIVSDRKKINLNSIKEE